MKMISKIGRGRSAKTGAKCSFSSYQQPNHLVNGPERRPDYIKKLMKVQVIFMAEG